RAVGAERERSVALPDCMQTWTSLLVCGRDSYYNDRLVASIRMYSTPIEWQVCIRVRALHSAEASADEEQAAQFGIARYFSAPQLLADMVAHVERALPGRWIEHWKIQESVVGVSAERSCVYSCPRSLAPVLDRLVAQLWPLEKTYVA